MSSIVNIYKAINSVDSLDKLLKATSAIATGMRVVEKEVVDSFIKKLPSQFNTFIFEANKEISRSDWEQFDRSFSHIMMGVLQNDLDKTTLRTHLKRVHAIESLARRQFKFLDERVKPIILFKKAEDKDPGNLRGLETDEPGSLEGMETDEKVREEALIAASRLAQSPLLRQMINSSEFLEAQERSIDLTPFGAAFDVICSFLEEDPSYVEKITLRNCQGLFKFALCYEFSELSERAAKFLNKHLPAESNATFEGLSPKLREVLLEAINGFECSSKTLLKSEAKMLDRYLELTLGLLNAHSFQKYVDKGRRLAKDKRTGALFCLIKDKLVDFKIMNHRNKCRELWLGVVCNLLGEHSEAKQRLLKTIELNPNDAYSYGNLGAACAALQQYAEAKRYLLKAIKFNPDDAYSYRNLGAAYIALKYYSEAKRYLLKAIELEHDDRFADGAFDNLRQYQEQEARQNLLKAIELDSDSGFYRYCGGETFRKLGLYDKAQQHLLNDIKPYYFDLGPFVTRKKGRGLFQRFNSLNLKF